MHTLDRMNRLRRLRNARGAVDLVSIMVGAGVIGLLTAVTAVSVIAVVPWVQDESAKQSLSVIQTAQSTADASEGHYLETDQLKSHGYIPEDTAVEVTTDATGSCYVATVDSSTGNTFYVNNKSKAPEPVDEAGSLICPTRASLEFPEGEGPVLDTGAPNTLTLTSNVPAELYEGDTITGFVRAAGTGILTHTLNWGALPYGVTLKPDGTLTGVASSQGTYKFNVKVRSSTGVTVYSDDFTVDVKRMLAPTPPVLTATVSDRMGRLKVEPTTCSVGTPNYRHRSSTNANDPGTWGVWSDWRTYTSDLAITAHWGKPVAFEVEAKCVRGAKESPAIKATASASNDIPTPSAPILSRSHSADLNTTTYSWKPGAVACPTGTVQQYASAFYWETMIGWGALGAFSTATSRNVNTTYQGFNYSAQAVSRCAAGELVSGTSGIGWGQEYVRPIDQPGMNGWQFKSNNARNWQFLPNATCPQYTSIRQVSNEHTSGVHTWSDGPNKGGVGWYANPVGGAWRTGWTEWAWSGANLSIDARAGLTVASYVQLKCVNTYTNREGPGRNEHSPTMVRGTNW